MAGVPVDVLTDQFTISYTPSGTQLARLRERERPSGPATLLALGDPVFSQPGDETEPATKPTPLPPGGLLIQQVVPQGNAAQARIEPGDVCWTTPAPTTTVQQLGELVARAAGQDHRGTRLAKGGPTDRPQLRPASSAWPCQEPRQRSSPSAAKRRLLAGVARGKTWQDLPGTRVEIAGLAELFDKDNVTLLADSDASEQKLMSLREEGELANFRYLHLATHGQANRKNAFESALILAQDHLSTVDDVAAGRPFSLMAG
jgi:hypothetical protein